MTRPFSPLALAALAAVPLSPAHASLASTSTPSFTCSGADPGLGGTVSWFGGAVSAFPELAVLGGAATPLDCSGGSFSEPVARKSGEGQKDFLKVTMKEVFITSLPPTDNTKKWSEVRNLLGEVVGGEQLYETYWNIFDEFPVIGNKDSTRSSFVGFKFVSAGQFTGEAKVTYEVKVVDDSSFGFFSFEAPLQNQPGVFSLTAAPRNDVPEPGTMTLLGTGLLGLAGAARRRRRW